MGQCFRHWFPASPGADPQPPVAQLRHLCSSVPGRGDGGRRGALAPAGRGDTAGRGRALPVPAPHSPARLRSARRCGDCQACWPTEGQRRGAGGTEGPGSSLHPLQPRSSPRKDAKLRLGKGSGAPTLAASPQSGKGDVRSGLGRKAATPPRWRPRPFTRAAGSVPGPPPRAHPSSEGAWRPSATARPGRTLSPDEDPLGRPPSAQPPAPRLQPVPRGAGRGDFPRTTQPLAALPRHASATSRDGPPLARGRPRAAGARPATGGMTLSAPGAGAGPCSPR